MKALLDVRVWGGGEGMDRGGGGLACDDRKKKWKEPGGEVGKQQQ